MTHKAAIRGVALSMGQQGMGPPAVLLDVRDEIVPIFVDHGQAQSIERAREGVPPERPLTHDLFVGVLEDLDVSLERVRIDDLSDETFHAKLDLRVGSSESGEKIVRDARPSDGLALAVRTGSPVLVADDVIDEAGVPPETLEPEGTGLGPQGPGGPEMGPGGVGESFGSEPSESEPDEESDAIDHDDAVDIDIDEPVEPDEPDENDDTED